MAAFQDLSFGNRHETWYTLATQVQTTGGDHGPGRLARHLSVMVDLFNRNKGEIDPPTSDSRIL